MNGHVEMFGVPGAGKSTIANLLIDELSETVGFDTGFNEGIDERLHPMITMTPLPAPLESVIKNQLWKKNLREQEYAQFAKRYPDAVDAIIEAIERSDRGQTTKRYFVDRAAKTTVAQRTNRPIIFDDSLLQFSVLVFQVDEELGQTYINSVPQRELIVLVSADSGVCISRQDNRKKGRPTFLTGLDQSEAIDVLDSYQRTMTKAANEIRSKLVTVDTTNQSPKEAVAEVVEKIELL